MPICYCRICNFAEPR